LKFSIIQLVGNREKAVIAYEKAAEANMRGGGTAWHAAKNLEAAAQLACDLSRWEAAAELLKLASQYYVDCGKFDPAAECLARGARWMEQGSPETACTMYEEALDLYFKSDMSSMAHDMVQRGTGVMLRANLYDDAAALTKKWAQICINNETWGLMCRAYLGATISAHSLSSEYRIGNYAF
jgi:gamma-soluble NSF attachment protein